MTCVARLQNAVLCDARAFSTLIFTWVLHTRQRTAISLCTEVTSPFRRAFNKEVVSSIYPRSFLGCNTSVWAHPSPCQTQFSLPSLDCSG